MGRLVSLGFWFPCIGGWRAGVFGCVVGFPGKLALCCFVVCLLWVELVIAGLGLMADLLFVLCVVAFWVGVPVRFGTRWVWCVLCIVLWVCVFLWFWVVCFCVDFDLDGLVGCGNVAALICCVGGIVGCVLVFWVYLVTLFCNAGGFCLICIWFY